uniref:Uncharacterized protein n=1 Tax=Poecilia reticulata TaxID=8081 RepID=A0A3P9NGP0_POERE
MNLFCRRVHSSSNASPSEGAPLTGSYGCTPQSLPKFWHPSHELLRDNGFTQYGLECLFRYYSYGLEKRFRLDLFKDFQEETLKDFEKGQLYGLEKFWAFLKYSRIKNQPIDPKLQEHLSKFRKLEDFRVVPPMGEEGGRRRYPSSSAGDEGRRRRHPSNSTSKPAQASKSLPNQGVHNSSTRCQLPVRKTHLVQCP